MCTSANLVGTGFREWVLDCGAGLGCVRLQILTNGVLSYSVNNTTFRFLGSPFVFLQKLNASTMRRKQGNGVQEGCKSFG